MLLRMNHNRQGRHVSAITGGTSRFVVWARPIVGVATLLVLSAACALQQPRGAEPPAPNESGSVDKAIASGQTGASPQAAIPDEQAKKENAAPANVERKRQISAYSADLLKLATDLKAEVNKTSKDTLSLGVIRKADEIERLTHALKDKMKPGTSATD